MTNKRIIYVHGRAPKPRPNRFGKLVVRALNRGMSHGGHPFSWGRDHWDIFGPGSMGNIDLSNPFGLAQLNTIPDDDDHKTSPISIAYYGDLTGNLMAGHFPEGVTKEMRKIGSDKTRRENRKRLQFIEKHGAGAYYHHDATATRLEHGLDELLRRPSPFEEDTYESVDRDTRGTHFLDDIFRIVAPLSPDGLIGATTRDQFPDLHGYLTTRYFGSRMRFRLQRLIMASLAAGEEIALVSHSMGCMIAYDVLWKLGHMSEYASIRNIDGPGITLWLTLGSPLNGKYVQDRLYDADEPKVVRGPNHEILKGPWVNIAAEDDFVSFDPTAFDDFYDFGSGQIEIIDERIFNPFVAEDHDGKRRLDPHAEVGYLAHESLVDRLAAWLK